MWSRRKWSSKKQTNIRTLILVADKGLGFSSRNFMFEHAYFLVTCNPPYRFYLCSLTYVPGCSSNFGMSYQCEPSIPNGNQLRQLNHLLTRQSYKTSTYQEVLESKDPTGTKIMSIDPHSQPFGQQETGTRTPWKVLCISFEVPLVHSVIHQYLHVCVWVRVGWYAMNYCCSCSEATLRCRNRCSVKPKDSLRTSLWYNPLY